MSNLSYCIRDDQNRYLVSFSYVMLKLVKTDISNLRFPQLQCFPIQGRKQFFKLFPLSMDYLLLKLEDYSQLELFFNEGFHS